ncbi:MAG TPA: hypothetical protein DEF34_10840 [Desulfotomaculum sp.]|nr:hypothetical protein [Desulfotomaculum sp.]
MTDQEFVYAFAKKKERFCRQLSPGLSSRQTLDLFEKWLQGAINANVKNGSSKKQQLSKNKLSDIFDQVVSETSNILKERGLKINCVCLPVLVNKSTSRCLLIQSNSSIYYRIRKTTPRKGKYKGENLISIELVADGNKNNIFMPLLAQKAKMERDLNRSIERESKAVEETGKYRLKILSRDFLKNAEADPRVLIEMLTSFILVTNKYLQKLSVNPATQNLTLNLINENNHQ